VLAEALLWRSLGDAGAQRAWLDPVLARPGWLELILDEPVEAGSLVRLMSMRAVLASSQGEASAAKRWSSIVAALWLHSDPELRPAVRLMNDIAAQ
jgi:hypothetical protein